MSEVWARERLWCSEEVIFTEAATLPHLVSSGFAEDDIPGTS
jgi:hypothetical protein